MRQRALVVLLSCLAAATTSPLRAQRLELLDTIGGGHTTTVNSLAFSPDGKLLASASDDQTVKLWSVPSGAPLATFGNLTSSVLAIAFSPDGRSLASGSADGGVKIWDVTRQNSAPIKAWYLPGNAAPAYSSMSRLCLAFSPDGKTLATSTQLTTLWDIASARQIKSPALLGNSQRLLFSPDGKFLAINTFLWDPIRDKLTLPIQPYHYPVTSVGFRPDGNVIVSQIKKNTLMVRDAAANKTLLSLDGDFDHLRTSIFNGTTLGLMTYSGFINLYDIPTGNHLFNSADSDHRATQTALSRDGTTLATADFRGTVRLWNVAAGRCTATIHSAEFVTLNPDGNVLAFSDAGALTFYGLATKIPIATLPASPGWKGRLMKLSPDCAIIAWSDGNQKITLCECNSGTVLATINVPSVSSCSASFSPDGKILVLGFGPQHQHRLELWNVAAGKKIGGTDGANLAVLNYGFSPDGRYFAVGCRDSTLNLWDLTDGTHRTLQGPKSPATTGQGLFDFAGALAIFSADGKSIMAMSARDAAAWVVESGKQIDSKSLHPDEQPTPPSPLTAVISDMFLLRFLRPPGSPVSPPPLALSPDRELSVVMKNAEIIFHDVATNQAIAVLQAHSPNVASAHFSPDGKLLALNLSDGTSRLHSAKTGSLVAAMPGKQRIVAFKPHDHTVISQGPDTINIWNTWDLVVDQRKVR